jgi:2'-5' RNA ligase
MEKTFRAFIAIGLSSEVMRWLRDARAGLEPVFPASSVRWTNPTGIHLTLKFLGEVPIRSVDGIRSAMDEASLGCQPFRLFVEGLGCFPTDARPRVIWAGIRRNAALMDLQKRLEDALQRVGFPKERRPFSPHLTLGRVRNGVPGGELGNIGRAVKHAPEKAAVEMEVAGYDLMKSILRPTGAEYARQYRTVLKA